MTRRASLISKLFYSKLVVVLKFVYHVHVQIIFVKLLLFFAESAGNAPVRQISFTHNYPYRRLACPDLIHIL
jgi:hypothetical protein